MRISLAALIGALALTFSVQADAREYPWCAHYGSMFEDVAVNCGFDTFQQCLATIQGVGGTCRENPMFFQAPRAEVRKKRRQDRR
jgi:hypothetical protein